MTRQQRALLLITIVEFGLKTNADFRYVAGSCKGSRRLNAVGGPQPSAIRILLLQLFLFVSSPRCHAT